MIGRLSGTLIEKRPPGVLIDAHGVGYEVSVPMSTFYDLPALNAPVTLLTHLVVREDAQLLYGFLRETERATFRQLIRITGVGPRIALAILSGISVPELSSAVVDQDSALLTRVPGIGKKTAERLLLELKGKLESLPAADAANGNVASSAEDITNALLALGYAERDAVAAARKLPPNTGVADGIRQALKQLAR